MADAAVSAVVELLLSVVKEQIQNEIQLVRGVDKELLDLSDKLKNTRNLLDDADTKQFKDKTVRDWLRRLEQTSHEMEDVLEEWNYALLQHKINESQSQSVSPSMQKVCSFIPSSCFSFKKLVERRDIARKVQSLKSRLDEILNDKVVYSFVISQPKNDLSLESQRVQSDSSIDLEEVRGRMNDRDNLVRKLTANGGGHNGLCYLILSIVGAGGLGKTTLAQLVYNDALVKEFFDLRIWLCVSEPFDVVSITKGIIESIKPQSSPNTTQLDVLLRDLEDSISGKKVLLVLDDVWNEQEENWKPLKNALKCVGAGSKVLVTTRKVRVAEIMGTVGEDIHCPELLSDDDCWLMMSRSALFGKNEREFHYFEAIGKEIAKRCNGLPLAAKTLGSVLRSKSTIQGWEDVLKSEMWELKQAEVELFPHLLLSYHELSPTLKHCFSYCALFPKDKEIHVENLIRLWMALGYLAFNEMELKGKEYFEDLAMRSLFQDFQRDDDDAEQIVSCKMHDIVHDFAQFLRKKDSVEALGMPKNSCQVCDPLLVSKVHEYRSLIWGEETPPNICDCLTCLRVLWCENALTCMPQGIEKLIHLRMLYIGRTKLSKEDVKRIFKLYFLQTLSLESCSLQEIPREIENLFHLRHLNLSFNKELCNLPGEICRLTELRTLLLEDCSLKELPGEIGNLTQLRHLELSKNKELKELPESMFRLIGLQTLALEECSFEVIPEEIGKLIGLRHLYLGENEELKELPKSIGSLLHLQTLDIRLCDYLCVFPEGVGELRFLRTLINFHVGRGGNKLGLLKKLNCLTGSLTLTISVSNGSSSYVQELVEDAREAELRNKIHLQELCIEFKDESSDEDEPSSSLWVDVIEALEPHHNLKELEINGYAGSRLPHWISSPLNLLRSIRLESMREVSSLPAMGKLELLEGLFVDGLKELKVVGGEWLGIRDGNASTTQQHMIPSSSSVVAFPKLKHLMFRECHKLEWEDITAEEEESEALHIMPSLIRIAIIECDGMKKLPHRLLRKTHSLQFLDIHRSSELKKCYGDLNGAPRSYIYHIHPQLKIRG